MINFGKIVGGTAANVVADEARAEGTMRTLDEGSVLKRTACYTRS